MRENTSKKPTSQKRKYNQLVVERLREKFGFTKYYIHQCLRDERVNETADVIKKEYKRLCLEVDQALKSNS